MTTAPPQKATPTRHAATVLSRTSVTIVRRCLGCTAQSYQLWAREKAAWELVYVSADVASVEKRAVAEARRILKTG